MSNVMFGKITKFTSNALKMFFFLQGQGAQNGIKNPKTLELISFAMVSCQRSYGMTSLLMIEFWGICFTSERD